MILGVNGIRLVGKRSGVGRAIEAILAAMGHLDHPFRKIRVYTPEPIDDEIALPPGAENVVLRSTKSPAMWEQFTLPNAHGERDLLFCPSYVIPVLARCPTFLVHHGSYEGYPAGYSWWALNKARFAYLLSARRATIMTTVSQHSKNDIVRFYGVRPSKVHVVPEGVNTTLFRPIDDRERLAAWRLRQFGSDVPFITYVGKPIERRNLSPLIRAFALLKKVDGIPHKMIIAGADLPGDSPFRQVIASEGVSQDVVVLGYVGHHEMALLYSAADLLVYPSSYEGFGMPVLEAMACGLPVIALRNTAFPEFAGGVARLLDNAEVPTLREGILAVLSNAAWRERMSKDGPRRAADYDWRLITRRYLDLMIELMTSGRRPL